MKQKEYPMNEDYNKALMFLTEQIAERDILAEQLKLLPPEARPEGLRLIGELNKAIERSEQALADEYEAYQKKCRSEEERDQKYDELVESLAGAYVHVKYRNPEILAQMEATINNMPPEDAQAFYDCAARLESGDLIGIIAREGETREQTEEFLKNYLSALKKNQ